MRSLIAFFLLATTLNAQASCDNATLSTDYSLKLTWENIFGDTTTMTGVVDFNGRGRHSFRVLRWVVLGEEGFPELLEGFGTGLYGLAPLCHGYIDVQITEREYGREVLDVVAQVVASGVAENGQLEGSALVRVSDVRGSNPEREQVYIGHIYLNEISL